MGTTKAKSSNGYSSVRSTAFVAVLHVLEKVQSMTSLNNKEYVADTDAKTSSGQSHSTLRAPKVNDENEKGNIIQAWIELLFDEDHMGVEKNNMDRFLGVSSDAMDTVVPILVP